VLNHNANNERIKRQYFSFLSEARRSDDATVDAVAKAIDRFEKDTGRRDFRSFHPEQAVAFKRRLAATANQKTGKPLSKATLRATLMHLKRFFVWLAGQPRFKSKIQSSDAEYFNLSEKDSRVATAYRAKPGPSMQEVLHVIRSMPAETEVQQRDRAVIAFVLLTGARDSAVASMRLKHVDLEEESIFQDAREVQTKFSKSFVTYFFPVDPEVSRIVRHWVNCLRLDKLWGGDDPVFPATEVRVDGSRQFRPIGLRRVFWSSAASIRRIFKTACAEAGVAYFNPHSIRKTLVQLGQSRCRSPEDFKAWSQNLGHEQVLTTFLSYGAVPDRRQREVMRELHQSSNHPSDDDVRVLLRKLALQYDLHVEPTTTDKLVGDAD
jgi:integrase